MAESVERSGWVSVRCVFRSVHEGQQYYEERITLWQAQNLDVAIQRAEAEAHAYAAALSTAPSRPTEYVGLAQAYLLLVDKPGDGAEIFSLIRSSEAAPGAYLDAFFDSGAEREQTGGAESRGSQSDDPRPGRLRGDTANDPPDRSGIPENRRVNP